MNPNASPLSFQHIAAELRLFHGNDSLSALKRELERHGCRRAVIISGRTVSRSDAMLLLRSALGPMLVGESTAVREHSPLPAVEEAVRFLSETAADSVVAVGGGSAAVTARAASILLAENRPVHDLCTRRLPDGRFESPKLKAPKLPQFVVPTTPSNAFVKVGSAVHEPTTGHRLALFDPKTRAKAIFVHPEFLRTSPLELVQSASLNTLSTAVEALESPGCDPISEAMLMHSLRMIGEHLPRLSAAELSARERLVLAAVLCGRGTDQAGGGLASVLAHAIGQRSHVANGTVNAIVLPHTMRYNAPATQQSSARIADALLCALDGESRTTGSSSAVRAMESLLAKVSTPRRLRDIGIKREELVQIADAAMSDWFITRNPRPVSDAAAVLSILEAAW